MASQASIVIPAHNEELRIRGLLETLSDPSVLGLYDIYVVCNGCSDRTREVAEEYAGVTVVEISDLGKSHALNEGDRLAGDVFPRLYCDADVKISPASITALVTALSTEGVRVVGPAVRYGIERSSRAVQLYFRALESRLMKAWLDEHLTGRGLYGASRAARSRFESFPQLLADDLFFDSRYEPNEKVIVQESVVTVWVPTNLRDLIKAEIRVAGGNQQFRDAEPESGAPVSVPSSRRVRFQARLSNRIAAVRRWAKDPQTDDILPLVTYLAVVTTAETILALRRWRGLHIHWR